MAHKIKKGFGAKGTWTTLEQNQLPHDIFGIIDKLTMPKHLDDQPINHTTFIRKFSVLFFGLCILQEIAFRRYLTAVFLTHTAIHAVLLLIIYWLIRTFSTELKKND